jgi:hypothetical protein
VPDQPGPSSLGRITCVTLRTPDLGAIEAAYTNFLGYQLTDSGAVSAGQAALWSANSMIGAPFILLSPVSDNDFMFRFVEWPADPDYVPYTTYGWSASELIVQDVDQLADELADSPFEIIGPPKNLSFTDDIRAMQVLGPANEILYLTQVKDNVPGLDLPSARCPVDRTFIVILAGESMSSMQGFYAQQFDVPNAPVLESRITVASKAFGLPAEQKYPIAALALQDQSFIEVDQFPAAAMPRHAPPGELPPGIAIVSFQCNTSPDSANPLRSLSGAPYRERLAGCCHGASGELIELLLPA